RICHLRPVDQQRSIQWHDCLGTINQADRGDRFAITISQGRIEQAERCAGSCAFAVGFNKSTTLHLLLFGMSLSQKTCESIDIRARSKRQLIIQFISESRLDSDERKRCRGDDSIEGAIHWITDVQSEWRVETESDRHVGQALQSQRS